MSTITQRARRLKIEAFALGLAVRHPGTPWYARLAVAALVAYAITPVDLVPDIVPVLGFIDDLVFVPIALGLAMRLVPAAVLEECRAHAGEMAARHSLGRWGWAGFAALWLALAGIGVALYPPGIF